jgi:uncharacterized membrane protein YecN with MAPEG domain
MSVQVTALYAALLGLIGLALAGLVGVARSKTSVSLNEGGDKGLIIASRRHLNWVETVPFVLLLMALIELNGGSRTWLHILGVTLIVARLVHPFGIDPDTARKPQRGIGAGLTFLVWLAASVTLLWQFFVN